MKTTPYGVSYVSALSNTRSTSHHATKTAAIKEAKALFVEGARNITTWRYSESVGAINFDWRKGGRL